MSVRFTGIELLHITEVSDYIRATCYACNYVEHTRMVQDCPVRTDIKCIQNDAIYWVHRLHYKMTQKRNKQDPRRDMPGADGSRNTNQNSGQGSRKCRMITLKLFTRR